MKREDYLKFADAKLRPRRMTHDNLTPEMKQNLINNWLRERNLQNWAKWFISLSAEDQTIEFENARDLESEERDIAKRRSMSNHIRTMLAKITVIDAGKETK